MLRRMNVVKLTAQGGQDRCHMGATDLMKRTSNTASDKVKNSNKTKVGHTANVLHAYIIIYTLS